MDGATGSVLGGGQATEGTRRDRNPGLCGYAPNPTAANGFSPERSLPLVPVLLSGSLAGATRSRLRLAVKNFRCGFASFGSSSDWYYILLGINDPLDLRR